MSINDELIWQSLNGAGGAAGKKAREGQGGFCSFKAKVQTQNFCRNEQNVTGLCNKSACPLANSRYATIREIDGRCYLMIKTIERAHMPARLWQKIKLPRNYAAALARVSEELEYFPKYLQHRNKQRLTRIHQYLQRMRKLALRHRPKMAVIHKKVERREDRKEAKALAAAKLGKAIEAELLQRLKQGTYGDIYNFPATNYNDVLDREQTIDEAAAAAESDAESEEERLVEFIEAAEDSESDVEDLEMGPEYAEEEPPALELAPRKKRKEPRRARVAIEYDDEESETAEQIAEMAF
mmetsp:Transcript_21034/g.62786  ORF Transcript_21034/g.62786 Transcript_21034/m.62786 type:complete len:296 (-) Transcript_21034:26-913(-)